MDALEEDRTMATATEAPTGGKPPAERAEHVRKTIKAPRRAALPQPARRRASATSSAGPGSRDAKPTLEQEVASEPEALVIAFKNDKRVYFVSEYGVTQRIEGDQVRLEKEPASATSSSQKGFLPPTKVE